MVAIFSALLIFGDLQEVTIQPFDFQIENQPETYIRGTWALYEEKGFLYFIPKGDPYVFKIDPKTKTFEKIGGRGSGPGELGTSQPWCLSLHDDGLWVLDHHRGRASFFVKGVYQTSFKVKSYQIYQGYQPKFGFAHSDQFVVIPAYPASGHLANVYDYSGEIVTKMGEILPMDRERLQWNPALNNTIWCYWGEQWYCLFIYRPTIRIFDKHFELEKEITIVGPEVDLYEARFQKMEEEPMIKSVRPHFTDFQVTDTKLMVMCDGVLYQMDHGGNLISRIGFYGNQELIEAFGHRTRVHFDHAVVMDSGQVYLGMVGSGFFDHDLWVADLPK